VPHFSSFNYKNHRFNLFKNCSDKYILILYIFTLYVRNKFRTLLQDRSIQLILNNMPINGYEKTKILFSVFSVFIAITFKYKVNITYLSSSLVGNRNKDNDGINALEFLQSR
jgi:hypothetical protein